jgi:hypothetical protein
LRLPSQQRLRRSHEAVTAVADSMVAALTSPAVEAVAFVAADSATVDTAAAASEPGLRLA